MLVVSGFRLQAGRDPSRTSRLGTIKCLADSPDGESALFCYSSLEAAYLYVRKIVLDVAEVALQGEGLNHTGSQMEEIIVQSPF